MIELNPIDEILTQVSPIDDTISPIIPNDNIILVRLSEEDREEIALIYQTKATALQQYNELIEKINNGDDVYLSKDEFNLYKDLIDNKLDLLNTSKIDSNNTVKPTSPPNVVNSIPMYTLDNNGNYILCEPDTWLDIGNGNVIPVYKKETVGIEGAIDVNDKTIGGTG